MKPCSEAGFENGTLLLFDHAGEVEELLHVMAMHLCGKIKPNLELIRDSGFDLVEAVSPTIVGGDVELPEVREVWGEKIVVNGGVPPELVCGRLTDAESGQSRLHCFTVHGDGVFRRYIRQNRVCRCEHKSTIGPKLLNPLTHKGTDAIGA